MSHQIEHIYKDQQDLQQQYLHEWKKSKGDVVDYWVLSTDV
jgi:hypothetical protein